jgi:capsular polysaccharide biosynthesis protein
MYVYNSSTRSDDITSADLTTSQKLVQTYIVILKSNSVLSDVSERLGGAYTPEDLRKMLSRTR